MIDGFFAQLFFDFARFAENRQFVAALFAVVEIGVVERALGLQLAQKHVLFVGFGEGGVIFEAGMAKKLGHHIGVFAAVLAQIERHQEKAAQRSRADKVAQARIGQQLAAVFAQGLLQDFQIGDEFIGIGIRLKRAEAAAQGEAEVVRFADQAGHNISNGAAVGLFFMGDFGVGRLCREREHGRVNIDAAHRERQIVKQFAQLAAVVVKHGVGMAGEGVAQGGGRHKRVAVAIAAYPAADLQQLGHLDAGPGGLELVFHAAVKFGQRFKKAERENRHAVVDFAVDGDFEMAGFAGLPQGQQRGVDFAFQFG